MQFGLSRERVDKEAQMRRIILGIADKFFYRVDREPQLREQAVAGSLREHLSFLGYLGIRSNEVTEGLSLDKALVCAEQTDFIVNIEGTAALFKCDQIGGENGSVSCIEQVDDQFISVRMLRDVVKHIPLDHLCVHIGINSTLDRDIEEMCEIGAELTETRRECLFLLLCGANV